MSLNSINGHGGQDTLAWNKNESTKHFRKVEVLDDAAGEYFSLSACCGAFILVAGLITMLVMGILGFEGIIQVSAAGAYAMTIIGAKALLVLAAIGFCAAFKKH